MKTEIKSKTAIRQLIERLEHYKPGRQPEGFDVEDFDYAIKQAESLEPVNEQQIKDAFNQGYREGELSGSNELNKSLSDVSQFEDANIYLTNTFEK